jgi:hypothetical protein
MNAKLDKLIAGLKSLPERLNETMVTVIKENETIIVELNSEEQLFEQGITRQGVHISDYAPYSPVTIEIKKEKGQPTNRVTLRDEGDFEQSFFIEYTDTGFEIKASDWKAANLTIAYGDEIMGLTEENLQELIKQYILPELIKTVNNV